MAQQISFSWWSKNGMGMVLLVVGWISIFQIIPVFHAFEVLHIGTDLEEQVIILCGLLVTTVVLLGLISSMLENLFLPNELYSEGIVKVNILLFLVLITYEIGYLITIPFLTALSPFVGIAVIADLTGITAFVTCVFLSLLFPAIIWSLTEYIPQLNVQKES